MSSGESRKDAINLEDFLRQLQQMKKMGPLKRLMQMLPGELGRMAGDIDEDELMYAEAILQAMTPEERNDPDLLLDEPRRRRIAEGAGRSMKEVNSLLTQFYEARRFLERR